MIKYSFDMAAIAAVEEFLSINGTFERLEISNSGGGIEIASENRKISVKLSAPQLIFRALTIIAENRDNDDYTVSETKIFDELSFMWDQSRNAVCNFETYSRMIRYLAMAGYTSVQLYTEDTYQVEGEPYFGYMRGAFSGSELQKMEAYAAKFGIEVIGCIQTLAHLNQVFRWSNKYYKVNDINDILLVDDEETYKLLDSMIKTYAVNLSSKLIHIGMDEAHMIGRGRYLDRNGWCNRFELMTRHLTRVIDICKKYGLTPMIWSDMYFRLHTGYPYYLSPENHLPQDICDMVPADVISVYWDYYASEKANYTHMIHEHERFKSKMWFAGGACRWFGFAPFLTKALRNSRAALEACAECGTKNIMLTAWGDNGSETSVFSILPAMQLYAEYCYRQDSGDENLSRRLTVCTKTPLETFMLLELPNRLPDPAFSDNVDTNPCKYFLYNDPLCGLFDLHLPNNITAVREHYKSLAEKLAAVGGEYGYMFDNLARLSSVLELKIDFGVRVAEAYKSKDMNKLSVLAAEADEIIRRLDDFRITHRKQWYTENLPFGFDIQDLRLGGLRARLENAKITINAYINGEIKSIREFDEPRLPFDCSDNDPAAPLEIYSWQSISTAGVL